MENMSDSVSDKNKQPRFFILSAIRHIFYVAFDDAFIKELQRRGYVALPKGMNDGSSCQSKNCDTCYTQ